VVNGAFAVAFLMAAYEHFPDYLKAREFEMPERGGATPDILDEARVEITWILKTQLADGSFSHKVTARGFEAEIMPETDHQARFFYSVSTAATGDGTAALAQAARVFAEFDPGFAETCLAAAQKGQAFLDLHPELIESKQTSGGTGTYATGRDQDARIWALAELWATTSDASYLSSLETRLAEASFSDEFDWGTATNLGLGTYLRSELPGRDPKIVEKLTASVAASAQKLHQGALEDVYGRDRESYYWGTNGVISRTAYNLALANSLFGHTDFLDTISLQLGHVFGLNGFGRSYVTQLGPNPVVSPHHRPSTADTAGRPWPGLMIGGPHGQGADERGTKGVVLPALDWQDKISNYYHNEIAINWNTALIYALVAALATQDGQTDACWPDTCFTVPGAPDGGTGGSGGAGGGAN
jgi:endoglucanase